MSARQSTTDRVTEHGRLSLLHRGSALVLGAGLCVFGVLGFVNQLSFFATSGPPILGLSSNGLLSTISLVFAAILFAAALRGGRWASTTCVVVGVLFLLSGVANVLVLATPFNVLAFRMSNVVFSLLAGLLLLVAGAYGRFTGRLPADNPYRRAASGGAVDAERGTDADQQLPVDHADAVAARELADAERDAALLGGTDPHGVLPESDDHEGPARRRALWRRRTG